MTRVNKVQKSRVVRFCIGGHEIPVGSAYSWATPGFRGITKYACPQHPFRSSHLTANEYLADYYVIVEGLEDDLKAWDGKDIQELIDLVENAIGSVDDCISNWEDQLSNMGDGLAEGDTGQTIQERIDGAESWRSELEQAKGELEDLNEPEDEIDPEESLRVSLEQVANGETHPIEELWDDLDDSEDEPEPPSKEAEARFTVEQAIAASEL